MRPKRLLMFDGHCSQGFSVSESSSGARPSSDAVEQGIHGPAMLVEDSVLLAQSQPQVQVGASCAGRGI